jgi:hypothetical protein
MRRRDVLRTFALVLAGPSTGVGDEPAPRAVSQPLSDTEKDALLAFAEVLVGDRPLPVPARAELLSHMSARVMAREDMLSLYREAAAVLDRLAGIPFSTLTMRDRRDLVARHDLAPSRARMPRPEGVANEIRRHVASDLIGGYYASPMGWALVGYGIFPGRCGDLARYTRPER